MNKCVQLSLFCVLILSFPLIFCNELLSDSTVLESDLHAKTSNSDFFQTIWQNSKQRRSVKSASENPQNPDSAQTSHVKPLYECGDRALTLLLKHADVMKVRIYGPLGDPLHLSQLAAFCGVSVKTTRTDLRLLLNYDSCYVRQEAAEYTLALSWYGKDMILSCPVSVTPPSIICKKNAMELTVVGEGTADALSVALNGELAPLLYVATQCWHREPSIEGELIFSVPYTSCGVSFRDGRFILDVRSKDKMMPLFCPYGPTSVFPVRDSRLSMTAQPLLQNQPSVYHKPPSVHPTKATAGHIVEQEQEFPVEPVPAAKPSKPTSVRPKHPWLPKIPTLPPLLPGSFNLAVNFPFSLPIPTRQAPVPPRDHFTGKVAASTPAPSPTSSVSSFQPDQQLAPTVQSWQQHPVSRDQLEELPSAPVTKTPISQPQYHIQYPHKFQKPSFAPSHIEPSPVQEYQHLREAVPSSAQYQPFESARYLNFPRPHQHQVSTAFPSFAQHPGYLMCPYYNYNHQPPDLPHRIHSTNLDPSQLFQYQKPDAAQLAPSTPAPSLRKEYSDQQLRTGGITSTAQESGSQLFQPVQYQPYRYQSIYAHQPSTAHSSPPPQFIPANLQAQRRPYPPYPAFQAASPFQSLFQQVPSLYSGSVQQPGSTTHSPVRVLSQESRPLIQAASQPPEYFQYQTGGDQHMDLYQRSVVHAPGTEVSSQSYHQPSQFSKFLYRQLRPELPSANVSPENAGSTPPKEFLQPRSVAPSAQDPHFAGHPFEPASPTPTSLLPSVHRVLPLKGRAQVTHLPYSQGPSVSYLQNPYAHFVRPSEEDSQKPQNDTLPLYQSYRHASPVKEQPRKTSPSGSYFYRPPAADTRK